MIWDRPFTLGDADRIWRVVERPTRSCVLTFATLAGIGASAFAAFIELALRSRTP